MLDSILEKYAKLDEVEAVALGGSSAAKTSDKSSDIDIYIFVRNDISLEVRERLVKDISSKYEVGGEYFGPGDEYFVDDLGCQLDIMYWNVNWFEDVVNNVWFKHYPSNGYTTCFLYTLNNFNIFYDKTGWLKSLQEKINTPYPKELKQNIIERNVKLMKEKPFASYYEQIQKAVQRNDIVSVNHRIAAFLASYFDVIFALNEMLHPGEKRLINYVKTNCKIVPGNFEDNINKLLTSDYKEVLPVLDDMFQKLSILLR